MPRESLSAPPLTLDDIVSGDMFAYTEKSWLLSNKSQVYLVIKSADYWSWYNVSSGDTGVVMYAKKIENSILNSFLNKDSYTFMSNITLVSTALVKKLLQSSS